MMFGIGSTNQSPVTLDGKDGIPQGLRTSHPYTLSPCNPTQPNPISPLLPTINHPQTRALPSDNSKHVGAYVPCP